MKIPEEQHLTAENIIQKLQLLPHPEGGYYRETYRGSKTFQLDQHQSRSTATAIYYLLNDTEISHLHRIHSDEIWLFHSGEPLEIIEVDNNGQLTVHTIGLDPQLQYLPQYVVKAKTWFAARVKNQKGYTLVSCIVSPGFDFEDFEMADKTKLQQLYPAISHELEHLCLKHT